uniref:Seminal fluid protein HACP014 n=1 Tax=Heliconius melpomene TaxID=34740 RepID=D9HQ73_HELME|nr:seminal fluid protein HACP014 [Heliconius melpomene]
MNLLKSIKMYVYKLQVSLLSVVLLLFGTLCLADGKANYDQMSVYIKHFTRNHRDVGFPIMGLKKILLPVPGPPHARKFLFIPSSYIQKYGNQYESNPNQNGHFNMFLENNLKIEQHRPTLAPVFDKSTVTPAVNIAANTISNNEITTESVITNTFDSQGQTDYRTTPIETTTDVVDYDDFNRMTLPPQVVASLLG